MSACPGRAIGKTWPGQEIGKALQGAWEAKGAERYWKIKPGNVVAFEDSAEAPRAARWPNGRIARGKFSKV
jgi:hypothetical protein